jgi:hypothetical protein
MHLSYGIFSIMHISKSHIRSSNGDEPLAASLITISTSITQETKVEMSPCWQVYGINSESDEDVQW